MRTLVKTIFTLFVTVISINLSQAQLIGFSKKVGGKSGDEFQIPSTRIDLFNTEFITRIAIKHGRRIEKIEIEYSSDQSFTQIESVGNDDGKWSYIKLKEGEFITYITGKAGSLIDQLTFYTSMRRKFGPYGGNGGKDFEITIPSDAKVVGFTGKVGPSINKIGLVYRRIIGKTRNSKGYTRDHRGDNSRYSDTNKKRDHRSTQSSNVNGSRPNNSFSINTIGTVATVNEFDKSSGDLIVKTANIPTTKQKKSQVNLNRKMVSNYHPDSIQVVTKSAIIYRKGNIYNKGKKSISDGTSNTVVVAKRR